MADTDPFAEFLRPPAHETPSERAIRKSKEAEEKRVNDAIDEQIKQEKQSLKQKNLTKVLLLGQSESGKSTTLKNFRMEYAREEWDAEKASWRSVIQLNLIRSITSILDALQAEIDGEPLSTALELEENDGPTESRRSIDLLSASIENDELIPSPQSTFSSEELQTFQGLRIRLSPLRHVEIELKKKLGAATEEVTEMLESPQDERYSVDAPDSRYMVRVGKTRQRKIQGGEMAVRGLSWREFLTYGIRKHSLSGRSRTSSEIQDANKSGISEILSGCKDDMKSLWVNEKFRGVLVKRNIEMENNAGFFLDDIERIASVSYIPSDDDVVRSRLRTLGVQEYRIFIESTNALNLNARPRREWVIYDVGGSRTMRRAWIPFFEGVNAIIFPVSCFNEVLLEDSTVNRLNDSVALWRAIVSSKLLQNTTLVCFLNKCDILKRKLNNGILFRHYVGDYGNQPNDSTSVSKFIKERFRNIAIKYSTTKRNTYLYTTSVTDTKATSVTLGSVRDSIFRENLSVAQLL
ncbi:G-protein alpha subunit [Rhodocollybia butyracea]|uniref:G-protein alpha subunit n=1 Tax=Rhodocollybia butyracea TaxID=206335 RepID=A0A9P5U427_9AGAR|nr:G-protein alpha subunit [Rhodocollybia butyracea]